MRRAGGIAFFLLALTGCGDGASARPVESPRNASVPVSHYDAASTGTITGRVHWSGPIPEVGQIRVDRFTDNGAKIESVHRPNPHTPTIDAGGHLAGTIVFLRGIDPTRARPWDHPPVTIEMHDERPMVRQGDGPPGLVGFVRRGDAITVTSKQAMFHSLRARRAAFFTLTLPDPDKPRQRTLSECGWVELTSGTGQAAMRGHLLVDDHPYYAITDRDGRFRIANVPNGNYQLVCWQPDWRIEHREHDPETLLNVRLFFKEPIEKVVPITVNIGETADVTLEVGP